jgi:hypothetical protein
MVELKVHIYSKASSPLTIMLKHGDKAYEMSAAGETVAVHKTPRPGTTGGKP